MSKMSMLMSRAGAALALCLLAAAPAAAEKQWVNGQAARLVIGQTSFTRADPAPSQSVMGAAGGVAIGADRLFVAGGNRIGARVITNRVTVYEGLSSFIPSLDAELPQDTTCPVCVGTPNVVLGQPNFTSIAEGPGGDSQGSMRAPSGVATDGTYLAVADTNNNRVLVWNAIPTSTNQAPNVVVGQPDMTTRLPATTREGMRGPQGVWIDQGKLFVADTQNGRILIWNSMPTSNGQGADIVVGQPDFDTRPEPDLTVSDFTPTATNMLDPASVSTNNGRMFVADLGFERVLIYNTIPTANTPAADVVIGQPNFTTSGFVDHDDDPTTQAIRASVFNLCEQIGQFDDDGSITPDDNSFPTPISRDLDEDDDDEIDEVLPRYPRRCGFTLNFPRFALSDGEKLYIADSGNDRILVYNQIPTENGQHADTVLGQPDFIALTAGETPGHLTAPSSLAHDGENLYVADPFRRRVLVFTPAEPMISLDGIRNAASVVIYSTGYIEWDGSTEEDQLVTVEIAGRTFEFRTEDGDTAEDVRDEVVNRLNADPDRVVEAVPFNGPGIYAKARIEFGGDIRAGDRVALTIGDRTYEYVTQGGADDPEPYILVDRFKFLVNADQHPDVTVDRDPVDINTLLITAAEAGPAFNGIPVSIDIAAGSPITADASGDALEDGSFPRRARLISLLEGRLGNAITVSSTIGGAGITTSTSGGRLTDGSNATFLPQGTIGSIFGENLGPTVVSADLFNNMLPTEVGGVQVYVNGRRAPVYGVAPNQVNFQVPWEIEGRGSSIYVRRELADGTVLTSIPRANETENVTVSVDISGNASVRFTRAAPGIFTYPGPEPRQAVALHGQSKATGEIALQPSTDSSVTSDNDDAVRAGADVTITINGRDYVYTTVSGDTTFTVRDRLVEMINNAPDPDVSARASEEGFFSAFVVLNFSGEPNVGDTVTLTINGREYEQTVEEGDTLATLRNLLIERINAGRGDADVTARALAGVGVTQMRITARSLNEEGNDITFSVTVSDGAGVTVEKSTEGDTLEGGSTPPVVVLEAREDGRQGNEITYSAESSDVTSVGATERSLSLCCGNEPFSLVTEANPAIPGELLIIYATGLGFPSVPDGASLPASGEVTPDSPLFEAPAVFEDFVSALAGERTASIEFAGLAPGFVGLYQINLQLNELLPDDPALPLDIAQRLFISNKVTIPVKNINPVDGDQF